MAESLTNLYQPCHIVAIISFLEGCGLLMQLNRPQQELLARFWPAVVANLSSHTSLVSLYLPLLHSSPLHSFPVSSCASRRGCNDESVAAVCLCVWHGDVSPLALTPSLSFPLCPPPSILSLHVFCICLSISSLPPLSFSHSQRWGIAWPPASVMEQTEHTDPAPTPTTNKKQELSSTICQLIFTGAISEIAHLTFRPNGSECRKRGRETALPLSCKATTSVYMPSMLCWLRTCGLVADRTKGTGA